MIRSTLVVLATVAAGAASVLPATADPVDRVVPRPVSELVFPERDQDRPARAEAIRMACGGRADGDRAAIGCKWTHPRHDRVAAYRLWRGTSRDDVAVIWRGTDQYHVDTTAEPGRTYGYLVEALSQDGAVVARSPVVWASADEGPSHA